MKQHTKESFAALLHGREYGNEISKGEEADAKASGLVVVFGYSDDNAEFRGVIHDEIGCCDGGELHFNRSGIVNIEEDEREVLEKYKVLESVTRGCAEVQAVWGEGGYSWTYETDLPHATFDIMEGDEKFCRGIVFDIDSLPTQPSDA